MEKIVSVAVLMCLVLAVLFTLGGTVIWLLWPTAVSAFPALVKSGVLAESLSWWQSVCLAWVCGALFKSATVNNKS